MEPLVSILIPAFNAEPWIAETINSALGQTWDRNEVIIVDDGSTDRTLPIARRCRVLLASDGTHFVSHARTFYRRAGHGSLSTFGRSDRALESQFLSMQLHISYVRSLHA
jgi:glycosyltransferase involved in cell wall biosynthesis